MPDLMSLPKKKAVRDRIGDLQRPQCREGVAASWKINQRPNTETRGHYGPDLFSEAAMVLGDLRETPEEKAEKGKAKGVSR